MCLSKILRAIIGCQVFDLIHVLKHEVGNEHFVVQVVPYFVSVGISLYGINVERKAVGKILTEVSRLVVQICGHAHVVAFSSDECRFGVEVLTVVEQTFYLFTLVEYLTAAFARCGVEIIVAGREGKQGQQCQQNKM